MTQTKLELGDDWNIQIRQASLFNLNNKWQN